MYINVSLTNAESQFIYSRLFSVKSDLVELSRRSRIRLAQSRFELRKGGSSTVSKGFLD